MPACLRIVEGGWPEGRRGPGGPGWLHLDTRAWAKAEACFQKLIKDSGNRNDSYAWLGLATLNLYSAPVDRKKARHLVQ